MLKDYLSGYVPWNPSDYTYGELLKGAKFAKERKMREKQEKQEKEEKEKKLIQQRTELLCSKKWKLKNMEYVVEREDDSVSVFELTKPAMETFSKNRWKIYSSDSTYQEICGDKEIRKGWWWFVSPDEIHEARPVVYKVDVRTKKNEVYLLTIDTLDGRQFRYMEQLSASGVVYNTTSILVTMEGQ